MANSHIQRIDVGIGVTLFAAIQVLAFLGSSAEQALGITAVAATFLLVMRMRWESKRRSLREPWFWLTMTALALIHGALLYMIEVPELPFGQLVVPVLFVDYFVVSWCVKQVEARFSRHASEQ